MTSWAVCDNRTCLSRPHLLEAGAYLVSVEIEEDPYGHLCDEDQQKEDKVLGTKVQSQLWPLGVCPIPRRTPYPGDLGQQRFKALTHQTQQAADLIHSTDTAQEAHHYSDSAYTDEDVGPHLQRAG